jgi:hypothetical protein
LTVHDARASSAASLGGRVVDPAVGTLVDTLAIDDLLAVVRALLVSTRQSTRTRKAHHADTRVVLGGAGGAAGALLGSPDAAAGAGVDTLASVAGAGVGLGGGGTLLISLSCRGGGQ